MATLTPKFDILPHGITKIDGKVYAIFKMIAVIEQFQTINEPQSPAEIVVDSKGWTELSDEINLPRSYSFDPVNRILSIKKQTDRPNQIDPNFVRFHKIHSPTEENTSFNFGKFKQAGKVSDENFDFWGSDTSQFKIVKRVDEYNIKQFEEPGKPFSWVSNTQVVDNYSPVLSKAKGYMKTKVRGWRTLSSGEYDLTAIYSSILDEPETAEEHFGLIREFLIEVDTILVGAANSMEYTIQMENETVDSTRPFLLKRESNKYYHGLVQYNFKKGDFDSLRLDLCDPFKSVLESKHRHPDGLYLIAIYKPKGNNDIDDPFKTNEHARGFNVLLESDKSKYDLCTHRKVFRMRRRKENYELSKISGHVNPRSIITTNVNTVTINGTVTQETKEGYRSSVLVAWRGENLIVNRNTKEQVQTTEVKEEKGIYETRPQYCKENEFVAQNFFTKSEQLVDGTQPQFIFGSNYSLHLRAVTPTNYYIKSAVELSASETEYTLSLEDLSTAPILRTVDFPSIWNDHIPIKSPTIVGKETYEGVRSDYVDNSHHLVLSKNRNEKSETRFIFPPQIKLQDFRSLGNMSKTRLDATDKDTFVRNCMSLENRVTNERTNKPPARTINRSGIYYLADTRATHLYIQPADLFTMQHLPSVNRVLHAFTYTDKFPFFNETIAAQVEVLNNGLDNSIVFNGIPGSIVRFDNLEDGIYNFHLFTTNDNKTPSIDELLLLNCSTIRISIVNKPIVPNFPTAEYVPSRNSNKDPNFWSMEIPCEQAYDSWKSIKYEEETEVFKLDMSNLDDRLKTHKRKTGFDFELLDQEYPYELFLATEGSLEHKSLNPSIYPLSFHLNFDFKTLPSRLIKDDTLTFFKLKLNDGEYLEAKLDSTNKPTLYCGEKNVECKGPISIDVKYLHRENCYRVFVNDTSVSLFEMDLKKFLNPDISIHDIEISPAVMKYLVADLCKLQFVKSSQYVFISDIKLAYSRKKNIQLFGSSLFQAYFPKSKSEFDMGTIGGKKEVIIPNNILPEVPKVDANTLLMHTKDSCWHDGGTKNLKEVKTDHLVRLTVQKEFMNEGQNKLGIVLARVKGGTDADEKYVSKIGEDITKMGDENWEGYNLFNLIDFNNTSTLFTKYFTLGNIKYYEINSVTYKVLECTPYYNAELKSWQVVLPFNIFLKSETMFLKFVCIKIAPGHSMKCVLENAPYSADNALKDYSGTVLSIFSDPVQLPIYSRKRVILEKIHENGKADDQVQDKGSEKDKKYYKLSIESFSNYNKKAYFVMCPSVDLGSSILNFNMAGGSQTMDSLKEFEVYEGEPNKHRIWSFNDRDSITISREHCKSIVLLEFEQHANSKKTFGSTPQPVTYNPLFDEEGKGLRLINVAEFEV